MINSGTTAKRCSDQRPLVLESLSVSHAGTAQSGAAGNAVVTPSPPPFDTRRCVPAQHTLAEHRRQVAPGLLGSSRDLVARPLNPRVRGSSPWRRTSGGLSRSRRLADIQSGDSLKRRIRLDSSLGRHRQVSRGGPSARTQTRAPAATITGTRGPRAIHLCGLSRTRVGRWSRLGRGLAR